jgi:hypothetical protein
VQWLLIAAKIKLSMAIWRFVYAARKNGPAIGRICILPYLNKKLMWALPSLY